MKTLQDYENILSSLQNAHNSFVEQINIHLKSIQKIKEKINFISDQPDFEELISILTTIEWETLSLEKNLEVQKDILISANLVSLETESQTEPLSEQAEAIAVKTIQKDEEYLHEVLVSEKKNTQTHPNSTDQEAFMEEVLTEIQENKYKKLHKIELDEMHTHFNVTLNYAKRFQEAILPSKEKFKRNFQDYFILSKPKETVSGDFYWLSEINENQCILAVIDCTGHGVPGAFMSLLGYELLHDIIEMQKIIEPDKILRLMHTGVRRALKQHETHNRDGMDVAICKIDKKNRLIEYAGAHNPLLLIQNKQPQLIKADKFAVGGYEKEGNREFIKKIIPLPASQEVSVYLFTDGYQDQVGGINNRTFMASRLRRIINESSHKSMTKQKKILEKVIDFWMKGKKQLDDMLIIGVKI